VFKRLSFPKETPKLRVNSVFNRIEFPKYKFIRSDNGDNRLYYPINGLSYANAVVNGNNDLLQSRSETQSKEFNLPGLLPFLKFPSFPVKAWPDASYLKWFKAHGPPAQTRYVRIFKDFSEFFSAAKGSLASSASPLSTPFSAQSTVHQSSTPVTALTPVGELAVSMANIPIDPRPFVPHGFQLLDVPGRTTVKRVVVPGRSKANEDIAIATISPVPQGQIPFENIADVMQDFLVNEAWVGFRDIQPCPFGSAYVQFTHVRDKDRLIRESPIPFNDVHVSFAKHNEGTNRRKTYFNRECWLLLVGPPLDHWFTEDINAAFCDIGKVLLWEKDLGNKGRILAKVRLTELAEIPKSVRFTEGDTAESKSWTFSVEVLQESLLGGGPADEDPLPENGEDPHPLPNQNPVNPQPLLPIVADQGDDIDDAGGWDH
jgi:hypothetical protein